MHFTERSNLHSDYIDKEQEIWKPIEGFEGYYDVSNKGNIRSYWNGNGTSLVDSPKVLACSTCNQGYKTKRISNGKTQKTIRRGRLVAQYFIPNPEDKPEINHINGDKSDDRVENLEWVTASENSQHAHDTGLSSSSKGTEVHTCKLTENDVLEIRAMYPLGWFSYSEIAKAYNITKGQVGHIINKRTWNHI